MSEEEADKTIKESNENCPKSDIEINIKGLSNGTNTPIRRLTIFSDKVSELGKFENYD